MITPPVPIITHAAVAIAAAAGAWTWQANAYTAKLATLQTQYAQAQHRAVETAHAETIRLQHIKDAAQQAATVRAARMVADRDLLRGAVERLRNDISTLPACHSASTADPAGVVHTDPVKDVLIECSGVVADLAAKADGHASDVMTLREAWPE